MILRCEDPSFHWAASIKSIYSTKPNKAGILLSHLGKDNAIFFFYASLVFAIICALVLTLVYLFTWERPEELKLEAVRQQERDKQQLTLKQSLKRLHVELTSTLRIRIFRGFVE